MMETFVKGIFIHIHHPLTDFGTLLIINCLLFISFHSMLVCCEVAVRKCYILEPLLVGETGPNDKISWICIALRADDVEYF